MLTETNVKQTTPNNFPSISNEGILLAKTGFL